MAGPRDPSNENAGESLDVENFGGLDSDMDLSVDTGVSGGGQAAVEAGLAGTSGVRGSRGIGIGIGVAAGAATAHRGVKRELSDSNIAGGAAAWDEKGVEGSRGTAGDMAGRSMSEQQKLERRVSLFVTTTPNYDNIIVG